MIVPWRDRHGRFLPLKAVVLAAGFIPGAVLAFWWANGMLGGRPVTEVIHGTGDWAIRYLLISLAITPAARVLNWPRLLLVRRIVGLTALAYALAHLTLFVVDQNFHLVVAATEIVRRFYLTIGFAVLLGLGVLGVTSTNGWAQRLGRWWKRLHRAIYVLGAIALLHYFIQSKANVSEPVFFSGLFAWLLVWRALPMAWQRSLVVLLASGCGGAVRGRRDRVRLVCAGDRDQPMARPGGERDAALRPASRALRRAGRVGRGGAGGAAAHHGDAARAVAAGGLRSGFTRSA